MDYKEKIFMYSIGIGIIFSIPTFLVHFIPSPFDWMVVLSSLVIRILLPTVAMIYIWQNNKMFWFYGIANIILLPQQIQNCGIMKYIDENFNSNLDQSIDHILDGGFAVIIGTLYMVALYFFITKNRG